VTTPRTPENVEAQEKPKAQEKKQKVRKNSKSTCDPVPIVVVPNLLDASKDSDC
jgi:hypothetical protein